MTSTSFRRMLRHTPMRDLVRGRVTGRLDIERMLKESSLSEAAASKVRNVVKRTRLWRLEKVDVAHELIAHFADGREAGTPTEELLENFGDEKQTAKLIRRAKKRQRPMPWHVFAWARLCLLTFFGVYVLAALYLAAGSPSVTTDYLAKLNLKAAAVPTEEAAWPIYREALHEMGYSTRQDHVGDKMKYDIRPGDKDWPRMLTFLDRHADSLARIREASELPNLGYMVGFDTAPEDEVIFEPSYMSGYDYEGPHPPLMQIQLKHLGTLRTLARLVAADAARATLDGDGPTAYADIVAILGIADHADEHPVLISALVRLSLQNTAYRSAQEILTTRPDIWSDEQLHSIAHRIAGIEVSLDDWINGERLWFYDYLQRAYTDDGHGGGRITSNGIDMAAMYDNGGIMSSPPSAQRNVAIAATLPVAMVFFAPRDEMQEVYDGLMDRSILESRRPLWLGDDSETVDETATKLMGPMVSHTRYIAVFSIMPAISALRNTIQTMAGFRDGVLIGVALELYRREHGDWPGALEELVPGYLPELPVDRLTGEAVKYLVGEDGPVVYSVGVDGDDDGGRPPVERDGDIVNEMASPKQYSGESMAEEAYDGDWVLWPVPNED